MKVIETNNALTICLEGRIDSNNASQIEKDISDAADTLKDTV